MTVPSAVNRAGPYQGNGVTQNFPFAFRILSDQHVSVILRNEALDTEAEMVLGSDYSVSGVGNDGGGMVSTVSAPAAGFSITILRNVPFTQEIDLENQGAYYAETVEEALDLAAMRDQQMAEGIARSVKVPASVDDGGGVLADRLSNGILRLAESADSIDTVAGSVGSVNDVAAVAPQVATVAGISPQVTTVAGISGDVTTVANASAAVIEVSAHIEALARADGSAVSLVPQSYVATAGQTVFALPAYAISPQNVMVWISGVRQVPVANYGVSGYTLTLQAGVSVGTAVDVLVFSGVSFNAVVAEADRARLAANEAAGSANIATSAAGPLLGGLTGQVLQKSSNADYDYIWKSVAGFGDMLVSVYDPTGKNGDAFSMANMVEGPTQKIMTDSERTKLGGIQAGAQVNPGAATTSANGLMSAADKVKLNKAAVLDAANNFTASQTVSGKLTVTGELTGKAPDGDAGKVLNGDGVWRAPAGRFISSQDVTVSTAVSSVELTVPTGATELFLSFENVKGTVLLLGLQVKVGGAWVTSGYAPNSAYISLVGGATTASRYGGARLSVTDGSLTVSGSGHSDNAYIVAGTLRVVTGPLEAIRVQPVTGSQNISQGWIKLEAYR